MPLLSSLASDIWENSFRTNIWSISISSLEFDEWKYYQGQYLRYFNIKFWCFYGSLMTSKYRPLALILDKLPLCDCALVQFKDASVGDRFLFRSMGHIRQCWWLCGPAFQAFCPHTKTVPRLLWRCPRCRVVTQTPFDNWFLIWGPFPPIQLVLNLWGLFN